MAARLSEDQKHEKAVRVLLKLPENRRCINCDSLGPQYVCTTFSTFICTSCCAIHREFNHRVKSISMSKFTSKEVADLQAGGNERAREIYFKHWNAERNSLPDNSDVVDLRAFIKLVYVERRYAGNKSPRGRSVPYSSDHPRSELSIKQLIGLETREEVRHRAYHDDDGYGQNSHCKSHSQLEDDRERYQIYETHHCDKYDDNGRWINGENGNYKDGHNGHGRDRQFDNDHHKPDHCKNNNRSPTAEENYRCHRHLCDHPHIPERGSTTSSGIFQGPKDESFSTKTKAAKGFKKSASMPPLLEPPVETRKTSHILGTGSFGRNDRLGNVVAVTRKLDSISLIDFSTADMSSETQPASSGSHVGAQNTVDTQWTTFDMPPAKPTVPDSKLPISPKGADWATPQYDSPTFQQSYQLAAVQHAGTSIGAPWMQPFSGVTVLAQPGFYSGGTGFVIQQNPSNPIPMIVFPLTTLSNLPPGAIQGSVFITQGPSNSAAQTLVQQKPGNPFAST